METDVLYETEQFRLTEYGIGEAYILVRKATFKRKVASIIIGQDDA